MKKYLSAIGFPLAVRSFLMAFALSAGLMSSHGAAVTFLVTPIGGSTLAGGSASWANAYQDIVAPTATNVLIGAYYFVGSGAGTVTTVNTVGFIATLGSNTGFNLTSTGGQSTSGVAAPGTSTIPWNSIASSTGYQTILSYGVYGSPGPTISLTGLNIGQSYTARFWIDNSSGPNGSFTYVSSGGDTSDKVYPAYQYAYLSSYLEGGAQAYPGMFATYGFDGTYVGGTGEYVTATFTADSSTQDFLFSNTVGTVSAFEVLESVPEPSTVALMAAGVGLIGLVAVRRFRLATV